MPAVNRPVNTWIQLRPFLAESKYLMARGTWPHDVPDLRPHLVAGEQWQVAARGVQLVGQGLAWCVVPTLKGEYPISTIHLCVLSQKEFLRSQHKEPSFPFHDGGEDHYQDTLGWSCWYTWYCITCCSLSTGIDSVAVMCVRVCVYIYMMLLFQSCINREPKGYIRKSCNLLQGRCQFYVKRFCIYLG